MSWYNPKTYDVGDIKSKPVKYLLTAIIFLAGGFLIVLILSTGYRYISGQYTNLFGWEPNGPKSEMITFNNEPAKDSSSVPKDTITSKPNNVQQSIAESQPKANPVQKKPNKSKDDVLKKEEPATPPVSENSNNGTNTGTIGDKNVNYGTNNGIIGDNANVQVNPRPRPTLSLIQETLQKVPDLETTIRVIPYALGGDAEAYCEDLVVMLNQAGYKNVSLDGFRIRMPKPAKGPHLNKTNYGYEIYVVM